MADVFISYSRKDSDFVHRLHDALAKRNRDVWVDWEGIPLTANWWKEITEGIENADAFVFIISPDSVTSPICNFEVVHALQHNKRIVPIMHRQVDKTEALVALAKQKLTEGSLEILGDREIIAVGRESWGGLTRHNWVTFEDGTAFDATFDQFLYILDAMKQILQRTYPEVAHATIRERV